MTIDGDANKDGNEVTFSAGGASRILDIDGAGTDVRLRDLTLTGGRTTDDRRGRWRHPLPTTAPAWSSNVATLSGNRTAGYDADGGGIRAESPAMSG